MGGIQGFSSRPPKAGGSWGSPGLSSPLSGVCSHSWVWGWSLGSLAPEVNADSRGQCSLLRSMQRPQEAAAPCRCGPCPVRSITQSPTLPKDPAILRLRLHSAEENGTPPSCSRQTSPRSCKGQVQTCGDRSHCYRPHGCSRWPFPSSSLTLTPARSHIRVDPALGVCWTEW